MFCIFNPFTLPAVYKSRQPTSDTQTLRRCFGIALHHSIQAFKAKKNNDEGQLISSQKSLSLSKTTQNFDKNEKMQSSNLKFSQEDKKVDNLEEEIQKTSNSQNQKKEIKKGKIEEKYKKRRFIRKIRKNYPKQPEKKQEKIWKPINSLRQDEANYTASIPPLIGFSSRYIIRKIEQLNRRRVEEWEIVDPLMQKRKRYLKHLQ